MINDLILMNGYGIFVWSSFILTFLVCSISQIGDLFISYLKRKAKVKDTGSLLPGHGGVLDRLDGIFLGIPAGFLTIIIFVISLFSLTILLSLSNIQFEYSFKLAVLTLMNTVNSSAYGVSDFDFQNLHFLTKYFLIFFMIIGRVELLSLLLIAKKFLFKN